VLYSSEKLILQIWGTFFSFTYKRMWILAMYFALRNVPAGA